MPSRKHSSVLRHTPDFHKNEQMQTEKGKDIVILDNVIIGNNHLIINSSMLEIARQLLDGQQGKVRYYSDPSHSESVVALLPEAYKNTFAFNAIPVIHPGGRGFEKIALWRKKLYLDSRYFKKVCKDVAHTKPQLFLITTMIPFNLYRFLSKLNTLKNQQVLIILHGELEAVFCNNPSLTARINGYFYKKILKKAGNNIKFLVLSDYIKDSLANKKLIGQDRLISINHPLSEYQRKNLTVSGPVVFSHLGVANKRKNSSVIFDLARETFQELPKDALQFNIIGRVDLYGADYSKPDFVTIKSKHNQSISQEEYISFIEASHYSLIFLDNTEYVYRISGSVLDSVQYQLPLIALEHPFINELFEKGGDIGFLCKDLEEMKQVVLRLAQKDPLYSSRYETQIINLRKLAAKFYSGNVAEIISKAIKPA
ncbi:glycosyltransferase family protein [Flavobacterium humi]|uniref:Glycosyltransferase family 1 protein n=1 Tax=Flavobacterium humi TaxID=2562683 RepID=A0A4Z0L3W7_9FLAO|nr:hypothetical protein [Flavobacterium humi]TGD57142.1 hypothetical protein E4635_13315 [Flavobacterium humi]